MTEEARTKCSLRVLLAMLGNGKSSRLQMSDISPSSRARSARDGVRTGSLVFVVRSDWERFIARPEVEVPAPSLTTLVFLRTTWHNGAFDATVVARWMDSRLAIVPGHGGENLVYRGNLDSETYLVY